MTKMEDLSAHRLDGEPVPGDLAALVPYADELAKRSGIRIALERDRAPWADWSYTKEPDRDTRANIKAHEMVFRYLAFFAEHQDQQYIGYWRGPGMRPIAQSSYVWLDNEGQYSVFPPNVTAALIIADNRSSTALILRTLPSHRLSTRRSGWPPPLVSLTDGCL